ncbi:hypothetical protein KIH87_07310 [Paraneptunicella aestuarii]|uniref:hypothetical protein n=1 Tax=Paraneptunicella aestuarii TaxID=2831148 RepID=UPI001E49072A|nr:hypothetical protein [Paraneptunicella aestuarii]UAA40146.1 hypothetical protein KIH87_07310 [Paraneptunicella aestuarii]
MINELYSILLGYEETGVSLDPIHGDIQEPGKGTSFRVSLDEQGVVTDAQLLSKDDFSDIWTIGNGNKNQFPCAKLIFPTRPGGNEQYEAWKKDNKNASEAELLDFIGSLRAETTLEFPELEVAWPNYRKKVAERAVQLESLKGGDASAVFELFERYLSASENGLSILKGVDEMLWQRCQQNPDKDLLKAAAAVMFGEGLQKGLFPDGKRITLILDFKPDEDAPYFASSRRYVPDITKVLNKSAKGKTRTGFCPIKSEKVPLLDDKFPKVKLPVIGNTNLYSRYDGSGNLSVVRYEAARSDAYSISAEIAERLGAVLTRLTDDNKFQNTWDSIPSEASGPDLLLAFCREFEDAQTTLFLTGDINAAAEQKLLKNKDEKGYLRKCTRLFEFIKKNSLKPNPLVDIVVIRKINDGNQKVAYSTSQSIELLMESAEQWHSGCENIPMIQLPVKIDKDVKTLHPWTVAPKYFVMHSDQAFIRGGESSVKVQAIPFADVMRLFITSITPPSELTSNILSKLVTQFAPLLERVAQSRTQRSLGKRALVPVDYKKNKEALVAVAMLGLILFKRGRYKERYMEDLAFKLGQLLSAADELHIGYCYGRRSGQIPGTLIGNQCYGMAVQSPIKALALMANRIKPYSQWAKETIAKLKKIPAKSEDQTENEKLINKGLWAYLWYSKNLEQLTEKLRDWNTANNKVDDMFKAELMLGYLNGRPFTNTQIEKSETHNTKDGE